MPLTNRQPNGTISFGICFIQIISAVVAQSVAHLIGSEEVTGSIPVSSFIEKKPKMR